MHIRTMKVDDLAYVMKLEEELFPHSSWKKEDYLREIENNGFAHYFVLEDKEIIGYIGMWFVYEQATVTTIGISKKRQGEHLSKKLLGYALMRAALHGCEKCDLEVRVSNKVAIGLYKSFGFEEKAIRKNYYVDNHEDAYLMIKERLDDYGNDFSY